jgi:phospholipid transport system transporter-binding protein
MSLTTIVLPERLTIREGRIVLEQLLAQLQSSTVEEIDASRLHVLDSAAIALLLACQRQSRSQGRTLRVLGAPDKLRKLAQLYGVDELLKL